MIGEKYIELINKKIDGVITPKELVIFNMYLKKNPEAQRLYREMVHTSNLLSNMREVEPSPNLKKRIMNSIDLNRYAVKKRETTFKSLFSNVFSKPRSRLAYAFALGVIVGILAYTLFLTDLTQKRSMNLAELYGTIGLNEKAGFKTLDNIPIDLPEINGAVTLKQLNKIIGFEINLNTIYEFEILLEFDAARIRFHNFKPISHAKTVLESGENYIKTSNAGDIQYILLFTEIAPGATPINLKLFLSGNVRYSHKIIIEPEKQ